MKQTYDQHSSGPGTSVELIRSWVINSAIFLDAISQDLQKDKL